MVAAGPVPRDDDSLEFVNLVFDIHLEMQQITPVIVSFWAWILEGISVYGLADHNSEDRSRMIQVTFIRKKDPGAPLTVKLRKIQLVGASDDTKNHIFFIRAMLFFGQHRPNHLPKQVQSLVGRFRPLRGGTGGAAVPFCIAHWNGSHWFISFWFVLNINRMDFQESRQRHIRLYCL